MFNEDYTSTGTFQGSITASVGALFGNYAWRTGVNAEKGPQVIFMYSFLHIRLALKGNVWVPIASHSNA